MMALSRSSPAIILNGTCYGNDEQFDFAMLGLSALDSRV
jgi:hypothetical protein